MDFVFMNKFNQRKEAILSKEDKSSKGSWDSRIIDLCEKINNLEDCYTTSSCSGKCVILEEKKGKDGSYYSWSSHDLLDFEELKGVVRKLSSAVPLNSGIFPPTRTTEKILEEKKSLIKFKLQSPVLFVACQDISVAEKFFNLVREAGFKESGIHITKKLIGVEVRSGEKLEFPLFSSGQVLVGDDFLKVLVDLANSKLVSGWEKLEKLIELL